MATAGIITPMVTAIRARIGLAFTRWLDLVPKKPLIWIIAGRTRSRMPRAAVDAAAAGGTA